MLYLGSLCHRYNRHPHDISTNLEPVTDRHGRGSCQTWRPDEGARSVHAFTVRHLPRWTHEAPRSTDVGMGVPSSIPQICAVHLAARRRLLLLVLHHVGDADVGDARCASRRQLGVHPLERGQCYVNGRGPYGPRQSDNNLWLGGRGARFGPVLGVRHPHRLPGRHPIDVTRVRASALQALARRALLAHAWPEGDESASVVPHPNVRNPVGRAGSPLVLRARRQHGRGLGISGFPRTGERNTMPCHVLLSLTSVPSLLKILYGTIGWTIGITFVTKFGQIRPNYPQPSNYGHLPTLVNLVDEWHLKNGICWGHKWDGHAGTSDSSLPDVDMEMEYGNSDCPDC